MIPNYHLNYRHPIKNATTFTQHVRKNRLQYHATIYETNDSSSTLSVTERQDDTALAMPDSICPQWPVQNTNEREIIPQSKAAQGSRCQTETYQFATETSHKSSSVGSASEKEFCLQRVPGSLTET